MGTIGRVAILPTREPKFPEEEVCDIIDAILRNPAQRQEAGSQSEQIAASFDKSNFAEKIEDIYESVVP